MRRTAILAVLKNVAGLAKFLANISKLNQENLFADLVTDPLSVEKLFIFLIRGTTIRISRERKESIL